MPGPAKNCGDSWKIPSAGRADFHGLGRGSARSSAMFGHARYARDRRRERALREADFILSIGARFDDRVAVREFGRASSWPMSISMRPRSTRPFRSIMRYGPTPAIFSPTPTVSTWMAPTLPSGWTRCGVGNSGLRPVIGQTAISSNRNDSSRTFQLDPSDRRRGHRRGPASDVGGPVLQLSGTAPMDQFGGLGTMGLAYQPPSAPVTPGPTRRSSRIDGDGSFRMNLQELAILPPIGFRSRCSSSITAF